MVFERLSSSAAEGHGVAAEGGGVAAGGGGIAAEGDGVAAEGRGVAAEGRGVAADACMHACAHAHTRGRCTILSRSSSAVWIVYLPTCYLLVYLRTCTLLLLSPLSPLLCFTFNSLQWRVEREE